jgi:uncharacterized protein YycO
LILFKKILNLLLLFCFYGLSSESFSTSILKEGDIIFQETLSEQSRAIKKATNSKYTHVGIIFLYNGEYNVLEAVQPVKITNLQVFIKRSVNNHFIIKRIKNNKFKLTQKQIIDMKQLGKKYLGKDYDLTFEWSDNKIYCSELVWKIYKECCGIEIGKLEKLKSFNLKDPLVKKIMKQRYGTNIPYNEDVISPAAMFKSNILEIIYKD